jgi:hypothetical protein
MPELKSGLWDRAARSAPSRLELSESFRSAGAPVVNANCLTCAADACEPDKLHQRHGFVYAGLIIVLVMALNDHWRRVVMMVLDDDGAVTLMVLIPVRVWMMIRSGDADAGVAYGSANAARAGNAGGCDRCDTGACGEYNS